jgi:hypothetical protein
MDHDDVKYDSKNTKLSCDGYVVIIVGLENFTRGVVKNYVFWDAAKRVPLKFRRSF